MRESRKGTRGRVAAPPPAAALSVSLATLIDRPPEGDGWLHEIKLDGYRILARIDKSAVQLLTRRGNDWTARAPSVKRALAALPVENAVIDGELVSLRSDGVSDFQSLQNALSEGRAERLVFFAFDLLFLNGLDLQPRPLIERKQALAQLLAESPKDTHIRLSDHVVGDGARFFARACQLGLEGIIGKRANAPYRGGRSRDWVKVKCIARQEFVIGGYTPPAGARKHLGALLIGMFEDGGLRYAGKVGTGFSERSLRALHEKLTPLIQPTSPFSNTPRGSIVRGAKWVTPKLVAEVAFTEFTQDGRLRHPSFQGLREDKPARDVVRERPQPKAPERPQPKARTRPQPKPKPKPRER